MFPESSTQRPSRSSLYPFIINDNKQRYESHRQIIMEQQQKQQKQIKVRPYLLERYHDKSLIVKQIKTSRTLKAATILAKIYAFLYRKLNIRKVIDANYSFNSTNPQSNYLFFWNLIVLLCLTFNFYQIPIAIFFTSNVYQDQFQNIFSLILNYVILFILFFNMVYVIPTTQFYENGFLVCRNVDILKKYLNFQFFLDAIAWVVLFIYIIIDNYFLMYLKLIFYIQIYTLFKTLAMMSQRLELTTIRLAIYKMLKLILFILFIVLWLSCIYFYIDYKFYLEQNQYYPNNLWLTNSACANDLDIIVTYPHWWIWLNYSAYWTLQSISMVGYGDMTPRNPPEVIYCNLAVLMMTMLYAFFISGVWQIIFQARQMTQYQRKQWKSFKIFQKQNLNMISSQKTTNQQKKNFLMLKNKVGSYLYTMWEQEKLKQSDNVVQIIQQSLTSQLKDELFINYRQQMFKKIPLFGQLVKDQYRSYQSLFQQLIFKVKQFTYGKDQIIYKAGSVPNILFYLLKGRIILRYPNSQYSRELIKITQANFHKKSQQNSIVNNGVDNFNFGVKQFFQNQRSQVYAIAQYFCQVSELVYEDFINIIKQNTQLYNKYCQFRDQIKITKKYVLTGESCYQCKNHHHQLINCPQCEYFIQKEKVIKQAKQNYFKQQYQNQDKKQSRNPYLRSKFVGKKIIHTTFKAQIELDEVKTYNHYFCQYNI